MAYIEMRHCFKRYASGESEIIANNDVSFEIEKGELVIILGASGSGKSTILNILGGMDTVSEGEVIVDGVDIVKLSDRERTLYRRNDIGFVFQFYNLIPNLTARENVELALEIVRDAKDVDETLRSVHSFLVENNREFPLQGLLLRIPSSYSVMNRLEHLIIRLENMCFISCKKCLGKMV